METTILTDSQECFGPYDLPAAVLAPLPAGVAAAPSDPKHGLRFMRLQQELQRLDGTDFAWVAEEAIALLATEGKDLRVLGYLCLSALQQHGVTGLRAGLAALRETLVRFAAELYPQREQGQRAAIEWLSQQRLLAFLRQAAEQAASSAELAALSSEVAAVEQVIATHFAESPEPPSLRALRDVIARYRSAPAVDRMRGASESAAVASFSAQSAWSAAGSASGDSSGAPLASGNPGNPSNPRDIASVDASGAGGEPDGGKPDGGGEGAAGRATSQGSAIGAKSVLESSQESIGQSDEPPDSERSLGRQLRVILDYLRERQEWGRMVALSRAWKWGGLGELGALATAGRLPFEPPRAPSLQAIHTALEGRDWQGAFLAAERAFLEPGGHLHLGIQAAAERAAQGMERADLAARLRHESRGLAERFPELVQLTFVDGTPLLPAGEQAWFAALTANPAPDLTPTLNSSPNPGPNPGSSPSSAASSTVHPTSVPATATLTAGEGAQLTLHVQARIEVTTA
ncbi:hypothetical protein CKO15_01895 [Halorhodospira abdelmalekii]|uniref:TssA family type VI secretion system protein n=1 Tax=Halorhodospira abdelmalekii TaxID=421629 RepID=UPI001906FEFD|nr:TssA family type VI secretion system protein [Halorhodospira abdelmalekii]MBK1734053.1 hypothetical protein [Halorhodospira abdelmalekii]